MYTLNFCETSLNFTRLGLNHTPPKRHLLVKISDRPNNMKILQVSLIYTRHTPKKGVSLVKISDGLEIYKVTILKRTC